MRVLPACVIEKRLTFYNDEYKVDVVVNTKGLDGYDAVSRNGLRSWRTR